MFVVSLISRFMSNSTEMHMLAIKRCLRYLKGTVDYGILYKRGGTEELVGFIDSDYAGDLEGRKSTSGYVFFMNKSAVAWLSKKQPIVTLSTTEAEFIVAASCACQAVWMRRILKEIGYSQQGGTMIMCDNSSTIKLSKDPVMHSRSKHIDVRYFFLRDLNEDGVIKLVYCGTNNQIADVLTKPLKLGAFQSFREQLGVYRTPLLN
ncbi:secreted RxLR effector protein 161-like [Ricinus communis]|uniref:secreted RxLR effector protein 161-like n=1 Tax=Ricinus communis TaxID=3988 RepID=UPI00201A8975|nr:secreted RxLR effector protein 161-like [Ricinus communis]